LSKLQLKIQKKHDNQHGKQSNYPYFKLAPWNGVSIYIRFFVNVVYKWCRRLPNLSWGKFFGGFTVYCCRTVNYGRIYLLLLWCTQQLIIDLPYCWLKDINILKTVGVCIWKENNNG
jgi:hypothetical protein